MNRTLAQLPGYDVINRIGRGAGAVIYSGVNRTTRQKVAIKHVVRRSADDDKFLAQAETEYEVASRVNHPALRRALEIVRVRRWLKVNELFLVMELVDGDRLEDRFIDRRPEDFHSLANTFIMVADGLAGMHAQGYVHADIKPNNILLTREGGVKIIDFGQSCPMGHRKERIQGTPDYIAPEQVNLQPLDQRTDVYNLGATMYWVTTGKAFTTALSTALPGEKKIVIEGRRANAPPHELQPNVPLALSRLITDCCAAEKDARPWDMGTVINRLRTLQHALTRKRGASATG